MTPSKDAPVGGRDSHFHWIDPPQPADQTGTKAEAGWHRNAWVWLGLALLILLAGCGLARKLGSRIEPPGLTLVARVLSVLIVPVFMCLVLWSRNITLKNWDHKGSHSEIMWKLSSESIFNANISNAGFWFLSMVNANAKRIVDYPSKTCHANTIHSPTSGGKRAENLSSRLTRFS